MFGVNVCSDKNYGNCVLRGDTLGHTNTMLFGRLFKCVSQSVCVWGAVGGSVWNMTQQASTTANIMNVSRIIFTYDQTMSAIGKIMVIEC